MSRIQELIGQKLDIIENADKVLIDAIKDSEDAIFEEVMKALRGLAQKDGTFDTSADPSAIMAQLQEKIKSAVLDSAYPKKVDDYVRNFDDVTDLGKKIVEVGNSLDLSDYDLSEEQSAAVQSVVDRLASPESIDCNLSNPLKYELYKHIALGSTVQDTEDFIRDWIKSNPDSDGRLTRYAGQVAQDAIAQYSGLINKKMFDDYDMNAYRYVGSIIDTSRPQCIKWAEKGVILAEELEDEITWAKNNGSGYSAFTPITAETFPVYRGGHNCRHEAIPFLSLDHARVMEPKMNEKDAAELAELKLDQSKALEPAITKALKDLEASTGGELVGLKYRLKGQGSTTRKVLTESIENDWDADGVLKGDLNDTIRYTMNFDENYTGNVQAVIDTLKSKGYQPFKIKNYWVKNGDYKGINTNWVSPDLGVFELQFGTSEQYKVKDISHKLYEEQRDLNTSEERKAELSREMTELWATVDNPENIGEIKDFREERAKIEKLVFDALEDEKKGQILIRDADFSIKGGLKSGDVIKVYRGTGNNFSGNRNDDFVWVAENRDTAAEYASNDKNVAEFFVKPPKKAFVLPYKSNTNVRSSDIAQLLRNELEKVAGNFNDQELDDLFLFIDSYEREAGDYLEPYHTKISKEDGRKILVVILKALGFDAIQIEEGGATYAYFDINSAQSITKELERAVDFFDGRVEEVAEANSWGFTYNLETQKLETNGIVGAYKATQNQFGGEGRRYSIRHAIVQGDKKVGGWLDEDKFFYDSSKIFTDRTKALQFGIDERQLALFDLGRLDEIRLAPKGQSTTPAALEAYFNTVSVESFFNNDLKEKQVLFRKTHKKFRKGIKVKQAEVDALNDEYNKYRSSVIDDPYTPQDEYWESTKEYTKAKFEQAKKDEDWDFVDKVETEWVAYANDKTKKLREEVEAATEEAKQWIGETWSEYLEMVKTYERSLPSLPDIPDAVGDNKELSEALAKVVERTEEIQKEIDELWDKELQFSANLDNSSPTPKEIADSKKNVERMAELREEKMRISTEARRLSFEALAPDNKPLGGTIGKRKYDYISPDELSPGLRGLGKTNKEAFDNIMRKLDSLGNVGVEISIRKSKKRANYNNFERRINAREGVNPVDHIQTIAHEYMHALEDANPLLARWSKQYLLSRRKDDEEPKQIPRLGANEFAYFDDFINPYTGKLYTPEFGFGKEGQYDNDILATEILSMGIEMFLVEPWKLFNEDRGLYNYILFAFNNEFTKQ
jgi:hypothetical protein